MKKHKIIFIIPVIISSLLAVSWTNLSLNPLIKLITGTQTTAPEQPVLLAIDGDELTCWGFTAGSEKAGAEITLATPGLIYGLKLNLGGITDLKATVEFRQGEQWIAFAGTKEKTVAAGMNLLDLSYDRAVTEKLRLTLQGAGLAAGRVQELEILGSTAENIYRKIIPVAVKGAEETADSTPAEFLADGSIYTTWQTRPDYIPPWLDDEYTHVSFYRHRKHNETRYKAGRNRRYTDRQGRDWESDSCYTGGTVFETGRADIDGTDDDELYRSGREGVNAYRFPLPAGKYMVNLYFAEQSSEITEAGQRVFDINVEGDEAAGFDIYALAGGRHRALCKSFFTTVTDGTLDIDFTPVTGQTLINAIEIFNNRNIGCGQYSDSVELELDRVYAVEHINLYFTSPAVSDIRVEASVNDSWQELDYITKGSRSGWYRLVTSGLATDKIRITGTGYNQAGGVSEVEIWGRGEYAGDSYRQVGFGRAVEMTTPVNYTFEGSPEQECTLELITTAGWNGDLNVELNGRSIAAPSVLEKADFTLYALKLQPRMLAEPANYLRICPPAGGMKLLDTRLRMAAVTGELGLVSGSAGDGQLLSGGINTADTEAVLNEKVLVNRVEVYLQDQAAIQAFGWKGNSWQELQPADGGPGMYSFEGSLETEKLRITGTEPFTPNEVRVLGSPTGAHAPVVKILWPEAESILTSEESNSRLLIGFVDNPAASVTVNGITADKDGHFFSVKMNKLSVNSGEYTLLTATAVDANGNSGQASVSVCRSYPAYIEVNPDEELIYTEESVIRFTGKIRVSSQEVEISCGTYTVDAQIANKQFAVDIPLTEGFNLVEIRLYDHNKHKVLRTLRRKVVCYNREVQLTVENAEEGMLTNSMALELEGTVQGLGAVVVTVNDAEAEVKGMEWHTGPVELAERDNLITIHAVDERNREQILVLTVTRDSTAPVLSSIEPVAGTVFNHTTPVISGMLFDEHPGYITIDGNFVPLAGNTFTYNAEYAEGRPEITIRAVDGAGNTAEYTFSLCIDLTPPLAFTVDPVQPGWVNYNQPVITFETSDAGSGIDHYTVAVDGAEAAEAASPYQLPVTVDGVHTVTVTAFDRAGWSTQAQCTLSIDTTPPEFTHLAADPASWTAVRTPVITFSATDAGSGIRDYSIALDDGSYMPAESPFTLPELADGIHTAAVKAVDNVGLETVESVTVSVDTTPPENLELACSETGWTANQQPVLTFHATDALSGIAGYLYAADDEAFIPVISPYTVPVLTKGIHQLFIKAINNAGLEATTSVSVFIDTKPPLPFTATADPAGWTNNQQPVISFGTVDEDSGIHHYAVSIDESPFTAAESPYQLPEQTDGIHTVVIKAVDNAGNSITAQTKVYIDTIAPAAPADLHVIPGNGRLTIKSSELSLDTTSYVLARIPAWPEGAKTLTNYTEEQLTSADGTSITYQLIEYLDENLENGSAYSYSLYAVDRAGNAGSAALTAGTAGLEQEYYDPEQGAVAEYEGVTLLIEKESLPAEVKTIEISEIQSEEMENRANFPIIGSIYQFSVVLDNAGTDLPLDHITFENEYTARLEYDENLVPEDFPEENLGVYYFDPMWCKWFRVNNALVDKTSNTILFKTNHFTGLTVQPTMIEDLSPQELADTGYSPFKTYSTHQGVTVSPQGGTAMTSATDLVLPGKNGFDFAIKRTYDTATAQGDALGMGIYASMGINASLLGGIQDMVNAEKTAVDIISFITSNIDTGTSLPGVENMIKQFLQNNGDYAYSMGNGWRLNLPYIHSTNSTVLVRTPDGAFHDINNMTLVENKSFLLLRTLEMENHEGDDFSLSVTQAKLDFDCTSLLSGSIKIPGWLTLEAQLTMKDGTRYTFDEFGRTTKIKDPSGLNTINIHYKNLLTDGTAVIDYMEDSMQRIIRFNYDTACFIPRISNITVEAADPADNITITYYQESGVIPGLEDLMPMLTKVVDAEGREYTYTYGDNFIINFGLAADVNWLVSGADLFLGGGLSAATGWDYVTLTGSMDFKWVKPLTELKGPGIGTTRISYDQEMMSYTDALPSDFIFSLLPVGTEFSFGTNTRLLATQLEVLEGTPGNGSTRRTTYNYNFEYAGMKQFYNTLAEENDGRKLTKYHYENTWKYRNRYLDISDWATDLLNNNGGISPIKWIDPFMEFAADIEAAPRNTKVETYDLQNNSKKLETISLKYDNNDKITKQRTERTATQYLETNYQYDNWGNVTYENNTSISGDRTNQTEKWMSYYNTNSTLPAAQAALVTKTYTAPEPEKPIYNLLKNQLVKNYIYPAEGDPTSSYQLMVNQYSNKAQLTASSTWSAQHQQWLETKFEYTDTYGRITKITDPLLHITDYIYNDNYSTDEYSVQIIQRAVNDADGSTRDITTETGYAKLTGWKTWEKDGRENITEYQYDKLGRIREIKEPLDEGMTEQPVTSITYDDITIKARAVYPGGAVITYDYDNLGRLVEIIKENRPRDAAGILIAGAPVTLNTTKLTYDPWNNITSVTDPNQHITTYGYDTMGRNNKITYPAENNIAAMITMNYDYETNTHTITNERGKQTVEKYNMIGKLISRTQYNGLDEINTTTWYDGLGNPVRSIDPKGNITLNSYNEYNKVVLTTLPEETFYADNSEFTFSPYVRYEYNKAGYNTAQYTGIKPGVELAVTNTVDNLGKIIQTAQQYTDYTVTPATLKTATQKIYYDNNGNQIKVVDANNTGKAAADQKYHTYTYTRRNQVQTETDPAGNTTSYTYDLAGNKTSVTDPRGNATENDQPKYTGDFTINYRYDDLKRLILAELPKAKTDTDKPAVSFTYDPRGNVLLRTEPDGGRTVYTYTSRNKPQTETRTGSGKAYTTTYDYDEATNLTATEDNAGNRTERTYDDLNRLTSVTYPEGNSEEYIYDKNNNQTSIRDGNWHTTNTDYNAYNKPITITDAKNNKTYYKYDARGNLAWQQDVNSNISKYNYDELNRLVEEITAQGYHTYYGYDAAGNKTYSQDPNQTTGTYSYTDNNLLETILLTNPNSDTETVTYTYDEAGNIKTLTNNNVTTSYNLNAAGIYEPDPYSRANRATRQLDNRTFDVQYTYDSMNRLTELTYPTNRTVTYNYNQLGQFTTVPGYIDTPPSYNNLGLLETLTAANGVTTTYQYDDNYRLTDLHYTKAQEELKTYDLTYDDANNILSKNDSDFAYDELNRLTTAYLRGRFAIDIKDREQKTGTVQDDLFGTEPLTFNISQTEVKLDYAAMSIGVDLEGTYDINKLQISTNIAGHRIHSRSLGVFISQTNIADDYTKVEEWILKEISPTVMEIRLKTPVKARYIKLHCYYDDRDDEEQPIDKATFKNDKTEILKVYYMLNTRQEAYSYDNKGNRLTSSVTVENTETKNYTYYPNSDRLKTDSTYGYQWDANGNLTARGKVYTMENETLIFDNSNGEYWEYKYDLFNRLIAVHKSDAGTQNKTLVASYVYDGNNIRIKKVSAQEGTTYYIYGQNGEVLYEEQVDKYAEYIYVNGKHFAKNEGTVGGDGSERKRYFYATDHLGSTEVITDETGGVVWQDEMTPFGESSGTTGYLDARAKFTGKDMDAEVGWYYFNARWYSPDVGRFTTVDPVQDGANWYVYCGGNPVRFVDSRGTDVESSIYEADDFLEKQAEYSKQKTQESMQKLDILSALIHDFNFCFYSVLSWFLPGDRDEMGLVITTAGMGPEIKMAGEAVPHIVNTARGGLAKLWSKKAVEVADDIVDDIADDVLNVADDLMDDSAKVVDEVIDEGVNLADETASGGRMAQNIGQEREKTVADIIDGTISGEKIKSSAGGTDLDVLGPNGELVMVGGPAKAKDLGKLGQVIQIYKDEAAARGGVKVIAYFAKGTPQNVIDLAVKKLGAENVKIFE